MMYEATVWGLFGLAGICLVGITPLVANKYKPVSIRVLGVVCVLSLVGGILALVYGHAEPKSAGAKEGTNAVAASKVAPEAPTSAGLNVGTDAVVMGKIAPNAHVGDGSVVIGATDEHGNTILNTPMAVGHDAHAGPGSIAIGAHAGAGSSQPDQARPASPSN